MTSSFPGTGNDGNKLVFFNFCLLAFLVSSVRQRRCRDPLSRPEVPNEKLNEFVDIGLSSLGRQLRLEHRFEVGFWLTVIRSANLRNGLVIEPGFGNELSQSQSPFADTSSLSELAFENGTECSLSSENIFQLLQLGLLGSDWGRRVVQLRHVNAAGKLARQNCRQNVDDDLRPV